MRIGIVSPYSLTVPGGVQAQVFSLARALNSMGHRARVLGPCDGPPPETFVTPLGASIPTFTNGSIAPIAPDMACTLRTIRCLADEGFDVLHIHEPICPGPCQTALFTKYAPVVGTWHAAGTSKAYLTPGVRWLADRVTIRVAVSDDARAMAQQALGGDYEIVSNGIDLGSVERVVPWPTEGPTIAYVGRHEPRKGLSVLLEAVGRIPQPVCVWVMSDGPQTEALQAEFGADERIEWLGPVDEDEKLARIKGADVFCVPSLGGESFGIVLLEGLAARTPVVASDLPGYRNVATTGDEAVLVSPGDAGALAAALVDVMGSRDRQVGLIDRGAQRASQFDMGRVAERYVEIYERAIAVEADSGRVRPVGGRRRRGRRRA